MERATEAITSLRRAVGNLYRAGRFAGPALPAPLVWSSLVVVLKELLQRPLRPRHRGALDASRKLPNRRRIVF